MHILKALKRTASLPSRKVATNHTPTNNKNNHDGQHLHSPYNVCLALLQALYIYQTKSSVFLTGPWERHCWSRGTNRKPIAQESMFPHPFVNTGYYLVFFSFWWRKVASQLYLVYFIWGNLIFPTTFRILYHSSYYTKREASGSSRDMPKATHPVSDTAWIWIVFSLAPEFIFFPLLSGCLFS